MATSTNILLNLPAHGGFVDTWDQPVNADFSSLDGFLAGVQAVNAAGASPITLTKPTGSVTAAGGPTQAENAVLRFTGILTGSVQVTLPLPGYMIIENLTTGLFVLSFRAIGSGEVIGIEQGSVRHIYNDGTNVRFVNLPDVGTYLDICDATVPAWITACTKPPYLNCNGGSFSAITYPYLNQKLGGTTLPDIRGTSRATLNQGTGRITSAGSGINGDARFSIGGGQTQTLDLTQIPAGISSPVTVQSANSIFLTAPSTGFGLGLFSYTGGGPNLFRAFDSGASIVQVSNIASTGTAVSNNTGGLAHPIMGPTTISGITLIRAA